MLRRFPAVSLAAVAVLATIAFDPPASANTIIRSDGNDTPGPLDLSRFRISHSGGGNNAFEFSTLSRFTNKQINGRNGWFEVDFNNNGDNYFDYWVVVEFYGGKLQGFLFDHRGRLIGRGLKTTRQRRSATLIVPLNKIGDPKSYEVRGVSVYAGSPCSSKNLCVDDVPNKLPLILHDLTPPTITWPNSPAVPEFASDASTSTTYPIQFGVKDDKYGSGLKGWTVQSQQYGTTGWTTIATGNKSLPTVNVPGVEGEATIVRVIATDKQGNKRISTGGTTAVPFDDRNAAIVYSASTQAAPANAFLSTTSSIGNSQTATLTTSSGWSKLCVIGGPTVSGPATATININGGGAVAMNSEDTSGTSRSQVYCTTGAVAPGANTVVITGTSAEPYVIDAIALRP